VKLNSDAKVELFISTEGPGADAHSNVPPTRRDAEWFRTERADMRLQFHQTTSGYDETFYQIQANLRRLQSLHGVAADMRFRAEKVIYEKVIKTRGGAWSAEDERTHADWLRKQTDWWLSWAAQVIKEHQSVRDVFEESLEHDSGNSKAVTEATLAELNLRAVLQLNDEVKARA